MSTLEKLEEAASSPSEEEAATIVEDKTENTEEKDDPDRGIKSINNYFNYSTTKKLNKWNFIEEAPKKTEIELKKAGVVYLSRIPTKMNVSIVREYFGKFGDIDRIFLEPRGKYFLRTFHSKSVF